MSFKPRARRPGRPREPLSREALLAAARQVFAEDGYDAASTNRIAELAGLRKPSLLRRFGTKEALYLEVMSGVLAALTGPIRDARLDDGDILDRLDRLGALIIDYLTRDRFTARLLVRELIDRGPFYRSPTGRAAVRAGMEATAAFLQAGIDAGVFARTDAKHLALSIASLHVHYFASPDLASDLLGTDPFSTAARAQRTTAVLDQVRRLCGAPARGVTPGAP